MTFNEDAKIDSSKVKRRGRTTGIAVGGGGLAFAVIALLVSQFLNVDISGLAGTGGGESGPDEAITNCQTGEDANDNLDCRIASAADSLDTYWPTQFSDSGYTAPETILFTDQVNTGCGGATSATGPFYCPADQTIYIDTAFYDELKTQYGANGGPLSQLYVLAHEWGHHIQHLTGQTDGLDLSKTGATSDSVKLELQADCYAGAWAGAAATTENDEGVLFLEPLTKANVADALSAASAVGDDRIQESAGVGVNPEGWTHGSSEQRQKWFMAGYDGGTESCDTFA